MIEEIRRRTITPHHHFELDIQLESSTILVQNLTLCQVRLKNDCRFPWIVLIPRRSNLVEIFDLTLEDQNLLWSEIARISEHMKHRFKAHKMNIEILGNRVRQLHIHIIARYESDDAWPNSVLNYGEPEPYLENKMIQRIQDLSLN